MPAKRKASASQNPDEPIATRRRTRTTAASLSSLTLSRNPVSQEVHPSPPKQSSESTTFSTPKRKKENDKRLTRSQTKASSAVHSIPQNGVPISDQEDSQSEDELSFLPARKVTNMKRSEKVPAKVPQLPRVFVEILSPARRTPKHLTANPLVNPASPTPTRPRVIRRSSPSPPQSPTRKKAVSTKQIRSPRPLVQPAPHVEEWSLSHSSSRYPPSCLYAQKRAILSALFRPNTAVFDREDEGGEPSANIVALEQLKALLTGTLERGEGNSCLLIGPRGSGKSHVNICTPDTSALDNPFVSSSL
jgi:origin recognition complex subunit 4